MEVDGPERALQEKGPTLQPLQLEQTRGGQGGSEPPRATQAEAVPRVAQEQEEASSALSPRSRRVHQGCPYGGKLLSRPTPSLLLLIGPPNLNWNALLVIHKW